MPRPLPFRNAIQSTIAIICMAIIAIIVGSCGNIRTHAGIEHDYSYSFDDDYYHHHHKKHKKHKKHHKKHHKHHHHDDDAMAPEMMEFED